MLLVIDNYDSFVYNLSRYFIQLGQQVCVLRNDEVTLNDIKAMRPNGLVLSPGPCSPDEAGVCVPAIKEFGHSLPILGICLGHQAIGQAFGGKIEKARYPTHGKARYVTHDQQGIYENIKNPFKVARYHSLIISKETIPDCLKITGVSDEGEIMSVQHNDLPIYGLQYHPESVLTEHGYDLLMNFMNLTKLKNDFMNSYSYSNEKII